MQLSLILFTLIAGATPDEARIDKERQALEERLDRFVRKSKIDPDLEADVRVFLRGIRWGLKYEPKLDAKDIELLDRALERARQRLDAWEADKVTWKRRAGKSVRGFLSEVDGSAQPYGLHVPKNYDPAKPMRLDVVLHGSVRPTGMVELRFMNRYDEGDEPAKNASEQEYLELFPLGRVENCYRWAGETDVFEAIEAVARNYNVDRRRIVLRGSSMGASGTWHLGLKHPDRFVALGPYCGYVDTYRFSRTPLKNFVKVENLPAYQDKMLHMVDSVDYAANAGVVPAIACMGEKDIFFDAHVIMGEAMAKEGLQMVNLIAPGAGHAVAPQTFKEQMRRIKVYADRGLDPLPRELRFVTWTVKYGRCHWLRVLALEEHYRRAEISASLRGDTVEVKEPSNIIRFAVDVPGEKFTKIRIGNREVQATLPATFMRKDGAWKQVRALVGSLGGKRPGVQGPIDDAFTTPFLCVRGTGKPWNAVVQKWADASLARFAHEWAKYYRGDLPVKNDVDVTDDDSRRCNLILFGDPGSNRWMQNLGSMPIKWTREELEVAGQRYPAAVHAPLLIQPSPFAGNRYVVFNSGHTFRESDLATINYLLYPHLPDWAVVRVGDEVLQATGFCDEEWRIK